MLKIIGFILKVSFNKIPIPFSCVYIKVWGPFSTRFASLHKLFVSFIDEHTRVSWVYLLKSKSDVIHVTILQNDYHTVSYLG